MSLYDRAKADNKKILNRGLSAQFILHNGVPDNAETQDQPIQGFYSYPSLSFDMEGNRTIGEKITVSFHLEDITIPFENENFEGWWLEFVDNIGIERKGRLNNAHPDKTFGMLTTNVWLSE